MTGSRWDIGDVDGLDIVGMPLLERQVNAYPGALAGVRVLYVNHAISDSLMVARGLHRLGALVTSVLVPYHGETSTTQRAIREAFAALGPSSQPDATHPGRFAEVMTRAVTTAVAQVGHGAERDGREWMIVEDGGYAFPLAHDDPSLNPWTTFCLGAVEHTTRGRWNYEYTELDGVPRTARRLRRPAVAIASSTLKTVHEGGFVAQGLLDECHWLLRRDHQFLRHHTVTVVGYGRVGRALARAISRVDARVLVVDPAADQVEPPAIPATLTEALTTGSLLVFGATGTPSFPHSALTTFLTHGRTTTLYLASASSKAIEFAEVIDTLERAAEDPSAAASLLGSGTTVTVEFDPPVGTRYHVTGPRRPTKHVVLLGNGYPVIFYPPDTHGAPNRAMDPVMTQLLLAAAGLPTGARLLPNRVHDVNDLRALSSPDLPGPWRALIDEAGLLRAWCELNDIDWNTYATRIEFHAAIAARGRP